MEFTLHIAYDRRRLDDLISHLMCAVEQGLLSEETAKAIAVEELMGSLTLDVKEENA